MEVKHPVSMLQELMARQHKVLPIYEMSDLSTRGCPRYRCTVKVDGIEAFAESSQKQSAKKQAAADALDILGYSNSSSMAIPDKNKHDMLTVTVNYNAIGHLNEYTAKNRLPYPTYSEIGCNSINEFVISCSLGDKSTEGAAPTKKVAKQLAAHCMLKSLENTTLITVNQPPVGKPDLLSDRIIIDKFKQLSLRPPRTTPNISELNTLKTLEKLDPLENKHHDVSPNESKISINRRITESVAFEITASFIEEFNKRNLSYLIDVMTRNPFVLTLKFTDDSGTTIIGNGATYQEAEINLFQKALKVINTLNESA